MSGYTPADPAYRQRVERSFQRQAFMSTLGARLVEVAPGFCEIQIDYQPALGQQHGFLHGGVVGALADTAAGYAAYSLMPEDSSVLTVEYKLNLLSPARGERFAARGRVERAGRNLSVVRAEVRALAEAGEKSVAVMLATMICLHGRADAPG
ncbi:PaaI family thioesterase [Thioalbus denitrificans]|uniref:Uncharacterized protein (TIGR00369 family) n=1 Tax=Thioalbus denitrificans TaxID=547122 RepID=A0A369CDS5_9GAMM|nr:PaaI family thioesterase [Thioalbus denitrificans]RCX32192.1 uncharacterized protein (TIGR00369 family) [Thioalbus denitrificans]